MNRRLAFFALILIGVAIGLFSERSKNAPSTLPSIATTLPAGVTDSAKHLKAWLQGLRGKTEHEISELLGKENERSPWKSGDQSGLELKFNVDSGSLELFFSDGRVVYATYDIDSSE